MDRNYKHFKTMLYQLSKTISECYIIYNINLYIFDVKHFNVRHSIQK